MRHLSLIWVVFVVAAADVCAHTPPLLPPAEIAALANELSGEIAKLNLEGLARLHRQLGRKSPKLPGHTSLAAAAIAEQNL